MKKILFIAAILLGTSKGFAQFLKINENDQSGGTRMLEKRRQPVDINSQLIIEVNQKGILGSADDNMLKGRSANMDSLRVDSLINRLKLYRTFIEKLQTGIQRYEQAFLAATKDSMETAALDAARRDRANFALSIVAAFPQGSRFAERREELLSSGIEKNKGSGGQYRVILRALADEIQYAETDLAKLRKEAGFYFQLAGWISTKSGTVPIHIEGFDDLAPGEFFEYERNKLYLSPEQMTELEGLTAFFESMDKSNIFEKLSGVVLGLLSQAVDVEGITMQVQNVKTHLNNLQTTAKVARDTIIARLDTLNNKWNSLKLNIANLKAKYTTVGGIQSASSKTDVLRGFSNDVQGLADRLNELKTLAEHIVTQNDLKLLGDSVTALRMSINILVTDLSTASKNLIDYSRDAYQMALYGRKINAAALEISEKVLKVAVDNLPTGATLDLRNTGKREPGDLIVLKAMLWRGENKAPAKTEIREFPMMNALAHVHMTVAYTFAKPVPKEANFKGGPLVSVLYKFKSHSLPYRNFLDPGIGLHAASYDFNNDDTPEFAGGIVASIFKDYLQFGWGFNFNDKKGYWFAGLRIPIPNAPVSMFGQSN